MNRFVVSAIFCVIFSFITVGYLNIGVWGLIIAQFVSQIECMEMANSSM